MAQPIGVFTSKVIPIDKENVDTDQIVPARYLKVTDKDGLADALFRDWRFEEDGSLKDPPFILDRPGMAGRNILLVGDNFGAGSSREHAPWALTAWGVRAILSTGFADIFRSNSLKNGLLPIVVPADVHARPALPKRVRQKPQVSSQRTNPKADSGRGHASSSSGLMASTVRRPTAVQALARVSILAGWAASQAAMSPSFESR